MAKPANGTPLDTGSPYYSGLGPCYGFLEGSGTALVDSAPSANDAVLYSSGIWSTDADGPILYPTDDTQNFPATPNTLIQLAPSGNVSWSVAFRASGLPGASRFFLGDPGGSPTSYFWFDTTNGLRVKTRGGSGTSDFPSLYPYYTAPTDWVVTFEFASGVGTFLRAYKNGSPASENPISGSSGDINISALLNGFDTGVLTQAWQGPAGYVYIWPSRLLDDTEVATLAADPFAIFQSTPASGRIFKVAGEGGGLAGPSRGLVARGARQQWARRQSGIYVPQRGA